MQGVWNVDKKSVKNTAKNLAVSTIFLNTHRQSKNVARNEAGSIENKPLGFRHASSRLKAARNDGMKTSQ